MSTLSSANVTDVNLVLKERAHKIKVKYSMHQYSNSYAYFRQLAHNEVSDVMILDISDRKTKIAAIFIFFCKCDKGCKNRHVQNGPSALSPSRSNMKAIIAGYYVLMTRVRSMHVAPFEVH